MADFNGGRRRKAPRSMAKLGDDLVLEIVARLPLKKAVQCTILNKTFRRCISHPSFARHAAAVSPAMILHCSGQNPKIYTKLCQEEEMDASAAANAAVIPPPYGRGYGLSVSLDRPATVMASCNGLLLLHFGPYYTYYVFNPVTAAMMFVDYPVGGRLGLAVDFLDGDAHFKLVSLRVKRDRRLIFTVVAPTVGPAGPRMALKSRVEFDAGESPARADKIQPVYADGTLYWLGDDAAATVAFDIERQDALVIPGPIHEREDRTGDRWFGFDDGSVRFVYALPEEIVICKLDHQRSEWGEMQRIPTLSNPSNNDYGRFGNGMPVFYGGGRLHFLVRKRGENGHVYVYDLEKEEWELRWSVAGWTDAEQHFFQYTPSIAKLSNFHYLNTNLWNTLIFTNAFNRLRMLLVPHEI